MKSPRFYRLDPVTRWFITALWSGLLIAYAAEIVVLHRVDRWTPWIWIVLAVLQLATTWLNYWTVPDDRLVQHGIFYRKTLAASAIRYAGPVRQQPMRWWLRQTVEVDVAGEAQPIRAMVAKRADFLDAIQQIAPQAEIVLQSSERELSIRS